MSDRKLKGTGKEESFANTIWPNFFLYFSAEDTMVSTIFHISEHAQIARAHIHNRKNDDSSPYTRTVRFEQLHDELHNIHHCK